MRHTWNMFPFVSASTYGELKELGDMAGKFLSSQRIADEAPTPEQLREDQAKVIYDQILAISYDHKDTERASRLAGRVNRQISEDALLSDWCGRGCWDGSSD